jgi:hypothetical protein
MGDAPNRLPYGTVLRHTRGRMLAGIVAGVIFACIAALIIRWPAIERRMNGDVGKAKGDAVKRANELNRIPSTEP